MPGSLLLSNDTYSDLSETSGRSLDSKTGGKKVSFNRAVRVKQYPWKPDSDYNAADHLTLPSNRFWFKVYKNKHDKPDPAEEFFETNGWTENNMECIHDSLAPIAEVEDFEADSSNLKSNSPTDNGYYGTKLQKNGSNSVYGINNYSHPIDPPVDYLDEMEYGSNRSYYSPTKTVWKTKEENINSSNSSNHVSNMNLLNRTYGNHLRILEEPEENVENRFADLAPKPMRLPRMPTRDNSPLRSSMRNFDNSDFLRNRERRSRSHDDYLDNDNRFKLRKADKAVSTEDLNSNHGSSCFTNRFLRGSRDMATQCYGTLTRDKNVAPLNGLNTYASKQKSDEERLNNFKSTSSLRSSFGAGSGFKSPAKILQVKKDEELYKSIRPHDYQTQNNLLSNEKILNYKKHDPSVNGKLSNGINKPLNRSESSVTTRFQNQNGSPYKTQIRHPDFQSKPPIKGGPKNLRENNQTKPIPDSTTLGYLRGRQIPLSEVNTNTNTNRKYINKNETPTIRNLFRSENKNPSPNGAAKPESTLTSVLRPKKFLSSNLENSNERNHKNGSQSAKSYPSSHSEGGKGSMIDWSLSGFQLAPKPDHGISSVSDSEYTVHRRPPLLMYIPGVSHHDRPAVDDDRMSHLSDLSRSELNESFGSHSNDRNSTGDLRRRYSMPRDGKLKWMKWRNKD